MQANFVTCAAIFNIIVTIVQVEKKSKSVGLEKEDTMNRARWRVGVGEIAVRVG